MVQKSSHTRTTALETCGEEGLIVAGYSVCAQYGHLASKIP
ncbi:hypothetical protein Q0590_32935 [Rhodocytophaga aerolata]|uniref:Uncharacterized protein n=1 Tax=Rhodocytophaga aerolata TaxID=455078 RepID=A0ABT8RG95_9BACT|nr:hypothetical protein [Rhodocytophaga aerolata]MDO1451126.1 hypothetical protein [Rhodocytophaga aerolata]